jgi:hypothetical protein
VGTFPRLQRWGTAGAAAIGAVLFAALPAFAQQPPTAVQTDTLLPFSTPFLAALGGEESRLRERLRQLDAVAKVDVVVSRPAGAPRVVVTLAWKNRSGPTAATLLLMRELARATVPGLQDEGLLIADFSGRIWYQRGQAMVGAAPAEPIWPRLLWLVLLALGAGVVGVGLCGWRWRGRAGDWLRAPALPAPLSGLSASQLAALLARASPAVRGAVVINLPEPVRQRVRRRVKEVVWPVRPPSPRVWAALIRTLAAERMKVPHGPRGVE